MNYAQELLDLAMRQRLDGPEAERRRCVSTAYYAVFHRLIEIMLDRFSPPGNIHIQNMFRRVPAHTNLKEICHSLAEFNDPSHRKPSKIPDSWKGAGYVAPDVAPEIKEFATLVLELHKWREIADYDLKSPLSGIEVERIRNNASRIFSMIEGGLLEPQWSLFLASFLMKERR